MIPQFRGQRITGRQACRDARIAHPAGGVYLPPMSDIFAPEGGWRVRLLDHSAPSEAREIETIAGFPTLMQANEFARRYVRDQIERCRAAGADRRAVLEAWAAFGEDAEVLDAGPAGWRSEAELGDFVDRPADAEACDWRALDPRRDEDAEDDPEA